MSGEKIVHIIEDPAFRDRLCAADSFLGGLEDDFDGPAKIIFDLIQRDTGVESQGCVSIMTARMHGAVMDRAESVFHRLAVRIGALGDIVTVDIKAECEDRSRRSGLDHGAETGETVHFFDDFRVGALCKRPVDGAFPNAFRRVSPEIILVDDLFSVFHRDPVFL